MAPPSGISSPTRRFVLTRLDGGVETTVAISSLLPNGFTSDQSVRAAMYETARATRLANPANVYLLYSPCAGAYYTNGDRIWDSRLNGGAL